jgi:uncharacterized membrane protein
MKNYFEDKLLKLGYPQRIAKEIKNNKELQREERITEGLLNEKTN